ncbi:MAG: DUF4293 domain-containing protein [Prolixibacteraceae bacterium]|jgi:glucan phosphoethanolaminetransferase (alkaline phosphatase superfamily)|nr:DUF4293 domain-containing protein [Prolixibacteraceae bacterium]
MIQRIQSVYLLLALIVLGLMGWLPLGGIAADSQIYNFSIQNISNDLSGEVVQNALPLMLMLGIIMILQIAVIFGFKNRVRQMRIATYNIILMLGLIGVGAYFAYSTINEIGDALYTFKIASIFPVVAAILNYLGIRAIGKDEALVRSIDRIR